MLKKKLSLLLAALLLSVSLISPALATPAESSDAAVGESVVQTDANESEPFGTSYFVKGAIVVGVGVVFYIALVIKSKGRKK